MASAITYEISQSFAGNAPQLDPQIWNINNSASGGSFYGETQIEQSLPVVANGALQETIQTFNPTGSGSNSVLGSEIISQQSFAPTASYGIAFTSVVRLENTFPGIVGGAFEYNFNNTTKLDNEIDFESPSNIALGQNNQIETNVYANQPLGTGNPALETSPNLSLTSYETLTIEYFQNQVIWLINGQVVRQTSNLTSPPLVPTGPLQFHINEWAPSAPTPTSPGFALAYSNSLQEATSFQQNQVYNFQIQSLSVAEITSQTATLTIAGTSADQKISDTATTTPFADVIVSDATPGQSESVNVTLSSPANGGLSDLGGGSYNAATGVYSVNGSAAAVTSALDGLVFTPSNHQLAQGQSVATAFTINVIDTMGATATDGTTTVIASGPANPGPVVTAVAQQAMNGNLIEAFTLDFSANVAVIGTPTLSLNNGGTAVYTGGYDTSSLTFWAQVPTGTNPSSLGATNLNTNGGTIEDMSENAAVLSLNVAATDTNAVNQFYGLELLRQPSVNESPSWIAPLENGTLTFGQVAGDFSASQEALTNVLPIALLYQGAFARAPDAGGFANWVHVYAAGMSLSTVAAAFVNSAEFKQDFTNETPTQIVTQFYENALDRMPDAPGLQAWVGIIGNGSTTGIASALVGIAESAEAQGHTTATFETWLSVAGQTGAYAPSLFS